MILGVGDGTFAVIFTAVAGVVLALVLGYLFPRLVLWTSIAALSLPFIVYAIIDSAPRVQHFNTTQTFNATLYNDPPSPTGDIHDAYLPVRIVVLTVLCTGVVGSFVVYVYDVLNAPLFVAPTVQCRRKQLEALHPSWYK